MPVDCGSRAHALVSKPYASLSAGSPPPISEVPTRSTISTTFERGRLGMSEQLRLYREFIDALVRRRDGVVRRWIMEKGWPNLPENQPINDFLRSLTQEQEEIVAPIAEDERQGAIHDALAWMGDEISLEGLRLVRNGVELAIEPYGTEMNLDFLARCGGAEWPGPDVKPEYRHA
jgi:hypothetical protein